MQFASPQEVEAKVDSRYRVFLILWTAILISVGILFTLAVFIPSSGKPNQTLSMALLGTGILAVATSFVYKQQMLKKAIEKQQLQALMSAYIVSFALCESAALFALMDHFTTGSGSYRFGFALAAIGMVLHFPKKEHLRAVSYKQF
jgi:Na+/H+-translocating membrane pyrophosphatase